MTIDLNRKLSENFQLWEFVTSQTAQRKGIDNTPTEQIITHLEYLCATVLEPAREALGSLMVSSGYRCPELNMLVGGSPTSTHTIGFAADIIPKKASKMDFAKWVVKNTKFDQVILEFGKINDPSWIHVSADPRNRKQVLRILTGTGYKNYKFGA